MLKFLPALLVVALAAPAFAQSQPAPAAGEKVPYACWYNGAGKLTGATPTQTLVPQQVFTSTGRGGDHAWMYGIHSTDGRDCPAHVRS